MVLGVKGEVRVGDHEWVREGEALGVLGGFCFCVVLWAYTTNWWWWLSYGHRAPNHAQQNGFDR
jgi:hypothetical protein